MNTRNIVKMLFFITTPIIIFLIWVYLVPKTLDIFQSIFQNGIKSNIEIPDNIPFTGETISESTWWTLTNTWFISIPDEQLTFKQKLEKNLKKDTYYLPKQPTEIPVWYAYNQRSDIIVHYLSKNTIKLPKVSWEKAYMYIKLANKPLYPIFIYWYGSSNWVDKKSWNLILDDGNVEKINDTEYVFNLSKIPYQRYYDKKSSVYDWLNDLKQGKSLFLAVASKGFDWNYVKEISIYTGK